MNGLRQVETNIIARKNDAAIKVDESERLLNCFGYLKTSWQRWIQWRR